MQKKLAPAGKNSTDISAGSAAFPISVKGVFLQWKVIANKQTLPFQIFYCYSITILHWLDMLPECQFSVTERSLQTIKGAHEWAQEHGSLFLHLPAPGDQLKISCFHDHQQKIKFFFLYHQLKNQDIPSLQQFISQKGTLPRNHK